MILVDTSVWINHFRAADALLIRLLEESRVITHPFVIGELALGNLKSRKLVLSSLSGLPVATVASDEEVLSFIDLAALVGTGVGYLDAHLLVAAKLTVGARIWTRDKRLKSAATASGLAMTVI